MTYQLFIMDRAYSSWSLRGFLMLEPFDIPHRTRHAHWRTPDFDALRAEMAPSRTVPALKFDDALVWDSLAMAETLAERHPDKGMWPAGSAARAAARSIVAEMHSGFAALRAECPMNLRARYDGFQVSDAVSADLERLATLWAHARAVSTRDGPYLFGDFTIADAFFAPVASRIDTYGLAVGDADAAYVEALHSLPALRRWRAMAFANDVKNPDYEFDLPRRRGWAGPAPLSARAVTGKTPVNDACPYSGKSIAPDSIAEIDAIIIGYCNPFCAAKSIADAEAWPGTVAILNAHR